MLLDVPGRRTTLPLLLRVFWGGRRGVRGRGASGCRRGSERVSERTGRAGTKTGRRTVSVWQCWRQSSASWSSCNGCKGEGKRERAKSSRATLFHQVPRRRSTTRRPRSALFYTGTGPDCHCRPNRATALPSHTLQASLAVLSSSTCEGHSHECYERRTEQRSSLCELQCASGEIERIGTTRENC